MSRKRFNLVCHGMMAFWQMSDTEFSVLVPDEGNLHVYGIGSVKGALGSKPSADNLRELLPGTWKLTGVAAGGLRKEELREQLALPVFKKDQLEIVNKCVRSRIDTPMPDRIRCYSGAEIEPDELRGSTPSQCFHKVPAVLHSVVVLTWFDQSAASFEVTHSDGSSIASIPRLGDATVPGGDLGVYAQEKIPHNTHPGHHGQGWNKMFRIRDTGVSPDLHLSAEDLVPDWPPESTPIGLDSTELRSLVQLSGYVTSQDGCGSGGGTC